MNDIKRNKCRKEKRRRQRKAAIRRLAATAIFLLPFHSPAMLQAHAASQPSQDGQAIVAIQMRVASQDQNLNAFHSTPEMVIAGLDPQTISEWEEPGQKIEEQLEAEITKKSLEISRSMVGDTVASQAIEANTTPTVISCSAQDYDILLRIVEAEAGICDYRGKQLVANVVINRVKNEQFPNTVTDVVYQENQFSPVKSGSINQVTVSDETKQAVANALAGEDSSYGALFFVSRAGASAENMSWFERNLTFLFSHDGHEFFSL